MPIGSLVEDPENARVHNERNQASIRKSLETFGQQKPIVVDSRNVVRAGNGTWAQAQALGWTHIAAVTSNLSDDQLKAYALADNISSDFGEFDPDVLRDQLESLDASGFELDAAGLALSEDDLEDLGAALGTSEPAGDGDEVDDKSSDGGGKPGVEKTDQQWKIIITCKDEQQQAAILTAIEDHDGPTLAALLKGEMVRAPSA